MYEIAPGPVFTGPNWTVAVADGDPLDHVLDMDADEQLIVLDPETDAAGIERLVAAGRQVLLVLPLRLIDRAAALAGQLAR